ncbi:MAG: SAM-dependent methyltransferase [Betaproteobacteria bacterium]
MTEEATRPRSLPPGLGMAVSLVSAAALAYEILLTRMFAVIQWHHFAYMIISVALLGYGAAGTVVTLFRPRLEQRLAAVFTSAAAAFGVTAMGCFLLAQALPFNALEFLWDARQPLWLLAMYLLLFVPFFLAAVCVCLAFTSYAAQARRVYAFDLVGAACGSLGVIFALFALQPAMVLACVAALAAIAAALFWLSTGGRPRAAVLAPLVLAVVALVAAQTPVGHLRMSQYKSLSRALEVMGAGVRAERSSPLGQLTVVESNAVPFRHAPGLSLNAPLPPPDQLAIFTDGEGFSALNRYDGKREPLVYIDYLTSALPYHLISAPRVLVLGAGAGTDVLQALYHGAATVDAVELNSQTTELVEREFGEFSGRPYSRPGVRLHIAEARGFVAASRGQFDVIQLGLLDAFGASAAGLYALNESYLYTVEALQRYLMRLRPDGYLAITRWVDLPPRDALKLFATAIVALENDNVRDPGARLAMIRNWTTATLIVKNGALTPQDVARLRAFSTSRGFDLVWHPGMGAGDADAFNRLQQPYFHEGVVALLSGQRASFIERYKFNIAPATDDRPYFFHFFRWKTLPELLQLRDRGGLPLLDWGYPLLIATLVQALVLGAAMILLPLARLRGPAARFDAGDRWRTAAYFAALGTGFMFVEIAFIQKFVLFLSHPLYSVAVVLFAFMLCAGLGSMLSQRLTEKLAAHFALRVLPVAAIVLLCGAYLIWLPGVIDALIALPDAARIAVTVLLILPLGLCMGMPFPLGLEALGARTPALVPWAWGINACTAVAGAVLASVLAIHAGFNAVLIVAVVLYASTLMSFPAAVVTRQ